MPDLANLIGGQQHDLHEALTRGVTDIWDRDFTRPTDAAIDTRMARAAVYEVLSALRANPAWCRSLGIGIG